MCIRDRHHLEPIKAFLPRIFEAFPNQVPEKYVKYLLGKEPVTTDVPDAQAFVSQFYKKLRDVAASDPEKFLGLMKGAKFTKD